MWPVLRNMRAWCRLADGFWAFYFGLPNEVVRCACSWGYMGCCGELDCAWRVIHSLVARLKCGHCVVTSLISPLAAHEVVELRLTALCLPDSDQHIANMLEIASLLHARSARSNLA